MRKCVICDKEINDTDETELFGCDGDFIHKSCTNNIDKHYERINNMTSKQFCDYLTGK